MSGKPFREAASSYDPVVMPASPRSITTSEWESLVLRSRKPVAVDFWHEHCVWCKRLDPEYAAVANEKGSQIDFYRLHVFQEPAITQRYGIQGTPTIKFFCDGREVHEIVGFHPKAALAREIDTLLKNYADCLGKSTPMEPR